MTKTAAGLTKTVMKFGCEIKVGDHVFVEGYRWEVTKVTHEIQDQLIDGRVMDRWVLDCKWSGIGNNPHYFNEDFRTARRSDLEWTVVA